MKGTYCLLQNTKVDIVKNVCNQTVAFVFLQNKNVWFLAFVFLQNVIQLDLKCSNVLLLEHGLDLVHNVHIVSITHLHEIWLVLLKYYKEFKYDFI